MNLSEVWEDDQLAFIGFLVGILPSPFFYMFLDNSMPGRNPNVVSLYAIIFTLGFWTIVLLGDSALNRSSNSEDEIDYESI